MQNRHVARGMALVALAAVGGLLDPPAPAGVDFDDAGRFLIAGSAGPEDQECCSDPPLPPNVNCPCGF